MRRLAPLLFAASLLGACGPGAGPGPGFGTTPLTTVSSESGALQVAVFTDPQPPVRGTVGVRLAVTDAAGAPVTGLTVEVVPWMNAMGHGSSVSPTVTARDGGVYELSNVYLFMPGQWTLRTTLTGSSSDHATPDFLVQ